MKNLPSRMESREEEEERDRKYISIGLEPHLVGDDRASGQRGREILSGEEVVRPVHQEALDLVQAVAGVGVQVAAVGKVVQCVLVHQRARAAIVGERSVQLVVARRIIRSTRSPHFISLRIERVREVYPTNERE